MPSLDFASVGCQTPFVDAQGVRRRIDFTISEGEGVRLALEVDGWDKRGRGTGMTRAEFTAWSRRELAMGGRGWTVLRFANSLVKHEPKNCARHIELTLAGLRAVNEDAERGDSDAIAAFSEEHAAELEQLVRDREDALAGLEARLDTVESENSGMKQIAWAFAIGVVAVSLSAVGIVFAMRSSTPAPGEPSPVEPEFCADGIPWEEAARHIGERVSVIGPVVDASYQPNSAGQTTFLNVGLAFPDPNRLTILIWGESRPRFQPAPEAAYASRTICAFGIVSERGGEIQMVVSVPGAITVEAR